MNVYDSLSPLYVCSKLFGLIPYKFKNEKNNRKYTRCSFIFVYSSFLVIMFIVCHYAILEKDSSILTLKINPVTNIADTFHIYGITILITFIFGLNYVKKENIIEALNEIHLVDQRLKEIGLFLPHKFTKVFITICLIVPLFGAVVLEKLNCFLFISSVMSSSHFCNLICIFALIITILEEFQFLTYLLLLKHRFRVLNSLLTNRFTPDANSYEKINRSKIHPMTILNCDKGTIVMLRSLHLRLCFAGKLLNEYFNIQILLLIGFSFVEFTTNAYYSFDVISDNFVNNNGSFDVASNSIIWTFAKFTELLSISVVCNLTKNEVNRTGEILYQLKNRFKNSVAPQIQLFGKQIMHCDFKITAFNFFDIDMTLFYGVIGSAATYLTILIQFEIAAESGKDAITPSDII